MIGHTVPEIADKISRLFSAMQGTGSSYMVAKDINDILIIADKIPINIVSGAWDLFAKKKGVSK